MKIWDSVYIYNTVYLANLQGTYFCCTVGQREECKKAFKHPFFRWCHASVQVSSKQLFSQLFKSRSQLRTTDSPLIIWFHYSDPYSFFLQMWASLFTYGRSTHVPPTDICRWFSKIKLVQFYSCRSFLCLLNTRKGCQRTKR